MRSLWHSSSTLALGAGCEYAWALSELQGLREPEIPWSDNLRPKFNANPWKGELSYKMAGAAFGKCGHATAETWYKGGKPDWTTRPGQALACATHLYPKPEACDEIEVEQEIGDEPSGVTYAPGTPWAYGQHNFIMTVHGIRLAGTRDLLVRSASECRRFELMASSWLLLDHKFRSVVKPTPDQPDPFIYWDTVPKLLAGVQSNLYALDVMRKTGEPHCQGRWVNMSNKANPAEGRPHHNKAFDFVITRDHALEVLSELIPLARRLDSIQSVSQAERNPETCFKFGGQPGRIGCSHHVSNGGTCDIKHTAGQLLQATNLNRRSFTAAMTDPNNDFLASLTQASAAAQTQPAAMPWNPPTVAFPGPSAVPQAPVPGLGATPAPAAPAPAVEATLPWMQRAVPAPAPTPAPETPATVAPNYPPAPEAPTVVEVPKAQRRTRAKAAPVVEPEHPVTIPAPAVEMPEQDPRSAHFWDLLVALAMSPATASMPAADVASRALALVSAGESTVGE